MKRSARARALDGAVVVSVAALALGAVLHTLDGRRTDQTMRPEPLAALGDPERGDLAARLEAAGVEGMLVIALAKCHLVALPLPTLAPTVDLELRACAPAVSPRSPEPSGWFVWRRPELLVARCEGRGIEVAAPGGASVRFVRGCAPAWRADGTLTYVRRGEATHFPRTGRARLALARHQLERDFGARRRPAVRELGWAGGERLAALVELDGGAEVSLAFYDGGRLVRSRAVAAGTTGLSVRPGGVAVALLDGPNGQPLLVGSVGAIVSLGEPAAGVSWSPDGRWLAIARADRVDLLEMGGHGRISLPVAAEAVAWR